MEQATYDRDSYTDLVSEVLMGLDFVIQRHCCTSLSPINYEDRLAELSGCVHYA